MGRCKFCGQEVGFLRRAHSECREKHNVGRSSILQLVQRDIFSGKGLSLLEQEIFEIARDSFIDEDLLNALLVQAWERAVLTALEDGVLSTDEEQSLIAFQEHFALSQSELDKRGAYSRLVKAAVIRDVLDGKLPSRMEIVGNIPFNLQKKEVLVWLFHNVKYYERRTRRKYVGGHRGVSIRVAKGVYYRVGSFRGNPVDVTETVHVDSGLLGVTNKHLYFVGSAKAFRIPYRKIVSFTPYSDGIGIQRDAMTAKPQIFVTGDGWFTYNLVTNLAQMGDG